ncbi:MAG: PD-(D/E)XK nuclease-like domain-containing protein [Mycobacterium sp.]
MSAPATESVPTEDGFWPGVPDAIYHADHDSLSSTGARKLLKSPYKFHWAQGQPAEHAKHFDLGHYVHGLVLGVGAEVVVIDAASFNGKAAQAQRDEAYAEGKVPILAGWVDPAETMAQRVRDHHLAGSLLANDDAQFELSAYFHDPLTGERGRAKFDIFAPTGDWIVIGDVKTTSKSADPRTWSKTSGDLGYWIQDALYRIAAESLGAQNVDFVFVNVETEPPHLVSVTRHRPRAVELGRAKVREAFDLYHRCRQSDIWPDWGPGIHDVDLPSYIYYQEEAE